jgi:DMSO/TMAO reductase YedYZ molybdopterin-dependent catalytic subunit
MSRIIRPARPSILTRRALLAGAALGALGCDTESPDQGLLGRIQRLNGRIQAALFNPRHRVPELPPGSETRERDFPEYFTAATVPRAPAGWTLKVGGLVQRPLQLTVADLTRMSQTQVRVRHHCVEGWSAVASWQGVSVAEIAERAGADPRAGFVEFRSFDEGYYSSWDRGSALHSQTILAYGMNGHPLTPGHGAPLRLYAGVKLGYKMVKYLTEVSFLPNPTGGTWEDQGYEWFAGV